MYTEEDSRRLLESRHDLAAISDIEGFVEQRVWRQAVRASSRELAEARERLRAAASAAGLDLGETDAARIQFAKKLSAAVDLYGYIRGKVTDALLNVLPSATPDADEMKRRGLLVDRVFGASPSELRRESQATMIEKLGASLEALKSEPDLSPLGLADAFEVELTAAESAAAATAREKAEDQAAIRALRAAREAFDASASAHQHLVLSILERRGRGEERGRYLLARDPAYAARRRARTPVAEEPGAEELAEEVPIPAAEAPSEG